MTARTRILMVPDEKSDAILAQYAKMGKIVRMPAPDPVDSGVKLKFGFWCVTSVAHLLGLRTCALRPDTLLRHCLANGGTIVVDDVDEKARRRPRAEGSGRTIAT